MNSLKGKKLLIIGATTTECDIVRYAKVAGIYTIVADYNTDSPAKKVADKPVLINALDVDALVDFCMKEQVFRNYAATGGPKGPSSLDTRYIYEDVPMELCMLEKLAANKGFSTPVASALITIASALKSTDYRAISYNISDIIDYI